MTTPVAVIPLSEVAVGSTIKLKENGVLVDYLVVHNGLPSSMYDASCDGVWLLRKDVIEKRSWDIDGYNTLEDSDIQSWLNTTMLGKYDAELQNAIKQVKIPYRQGGGKNGDNQIGASGLSCKVFLLSGYEVGWSTSIASYFPVDGAKLSYFESGNGTSAQDKRIAYLDGNWVQWWLRSAKTDNNNHVIVVYFSGGDTSSYSTNRNGVRPALILPSTAKLTASGTIKI